MSTTITTTTTTATATSSKGKTIALHVLSGLLTLAFLGAGGAKLSGAEQMVQNFARMGLPTWFLYVTGAIEVLAAILVLIPKTRAFGAALLVPTMIGAALAHLSVGDPASTLGAPVVLGLMSAVVLIANRQALLALVGRAEPAAS